MMINGLKLQWKTGRRRAIFSGTLRLSAFVAKKSFMGRLWFEF
jgi:hypothetical protein